MDTVRPIESAQAILSCQIGSVAGPDLCEPPDRALSISSVTAHSEPHALERILHDLLTWHFCWPSQGGEPLRYAPLSANSSSFIRPGPQLCTGVVHCTGSDWSPCPSFQQYSSANSEQTEKSVLGRQGSSCEQVGSSPLPQHPSTPALPSLCLATVLPGWNLIP